jgi:outer membrane protein assembly factor BamB
VVNASPLVTCGPAPLGLGVAQRAFISEYDGFGTEGRLTCINTSPFSAVNSFQPGEIVWSVVIGGSSGNTPAFDHGTVYVSTAGDFGAGPGRVLAFPAGAVTEPQPLWIFENLSGEAFFGGICIARFPDTAASHVYAASYAFFGGLNSANLVKLGASTGALVWSVPCNRTSATPVVLPDGRVLVSGGVRGYGTVPTLQLFGDRGTTAIPLWDSAQSTWTDTNHNGAMDPGEFLLLGGWSHQPAAVLTPAVRTLYCGAVPTNPNSTAACTDLYAIDISKLPTSPGTAQEGFLAQHFIGAGSTPGLADSNLYTIGAGGLYAFGPPPPRCDVNSDGVIDIEDQYWWQQGRGTRDVNLDGEVTGADGAVLEACVRYGEIADMKAGRQP